MKTRSIAAAFLLSASFVAVTAGAQSANVAPKKAPEGSTGLCKDGSYTTITSKRGACSGHKGVKTWYAETRATYQQQNSAGTNPPKTTPKTTPTAASPEPVASPAPKH